MSVNELPDVSDRISQVSVYHDASVTILTETVGEGDCRILAGA